MKKINRILKNEEFKRVLDGHKCVSRENFKIFFRKNDLEYTRVGVSVSSKIGNSVVRHKVKRQITNIVDKSVDFTKSLDIVIIARVEFLKSEYKENYDHLNKCLIQIFRKEKE